MKPVHSAVRFSAEEAARLDSLREELGVSRSGVLRLLVRHARPDGLRKAHDAEQEARWKPAPVVKERQPA